MTMKKTDSKTKARASRRTAPPCSAASKREPGPAEKRAIQYIADMLAGRK
jgi:hypothetical protein